MLSVEVSHLLNAKDAHLDLKLITGKKGLRKKINIPRIQKPGLALIGDISNLHPGRVQVIGKSEMTYLKTLDLKMIEKIIKKICSIDIACFIVTRGNEPSKALVAECQRKGIALFTTPLVTSALINRVTRFLEEHLTSSTMVHGVLMDVHGVGVLIIGKSGIGKSECALDLVLRGHRLVADDMVQIRKKPPATLYGESQELIQHHLEVRGLGIINIKDLFGVASIRDKKIVEIVVELVEWNPDYEYDRLGIDEHKHTILEVPIPYLKIPVSPARNVTTIIEVAARNHLLKQQGHFSSREFEEKLNQRLMKNAIYERDVPE